MLERVQVKICGLTSLADAEFAASEGADYLGFILHPKSPRFVSLEKFRSMAPGLAGRQKVAVVVEPGPGALPSMRDAGFTRFQVHFRHDTPMDRVSAWSQEVGADNLWLAPKLPPEVDVPEAWLELTRCFMLDTFDRALFGGTGRTGDWPKFSRHLLGHPDKTWILSGGLSPGNVGEALVGTRARFVDVSSGVESAPGIKDPAKLKAFFEAVRGSAPA